MRIIKVLFLAGTLWLPASNQPVGAQLVQIGPGYVKAPFVRVYTAPGGGSWVRAPFVSVYTPGVFAGPGQQLSPRQFGDPRVSPMPWEASPGVADVAELDWQQLRTRIRQTAAQLDTDLDIFGGKAAGWRRYLRTKTLTQTDDQDDLPPVADEVSTLQDALAVYDAVGSTTQYHRIAALPSFSAVHQALAEILSPPLLKQRRLLGAHIADLQRDLQQLTTGEQWIQFLELPSDVAGKEANADEPLPPEVETPAALDLAGLDEALGRFDRVSQDPSYGKIADLASFRAAHDSLAIYVGLARASAQPANPADTIPEELPPPAPRL